MPSLTENLDGSSNFSLGSAALWYAERGLRIVPCEPRSKKPLIGDWLNAASCDLGVVAGWWRQWPAANIGLAMRPNGLIAVDVDLKADALVDRATFIEHFGPVDGAAEAVTGSGGRHYVFRDTTSGGWPAGLGTGIDLRSNAQIIVAPSIHQNGNRYDWDGANGALALLDVAPAPDWLLAFRKPEPGAVGARPAAATEGAAIAEGLRNNTLTSLAGAMRRQGATLPELEAALLAANAARCRPPLPEAEVKGIAQSVARYEPTNVSGAFHEPRVSVDTGAARTGAEAVAILNAMPFWKGRLRWAEFSQSGDVITGVTDCGLEVRFDADRLLTFEHARQRIAKSTRVVIQSPRRGQITEAWGAACELILRAAADNMVDAGNAEDDLLVDLQRNYELSGRLSLSREDAAQLLGRLKAMHRDPHAQIAPSAAFLVAHEAWVYLPAFQLWLGTPPGGNRYRTLPSLRQDCGQLGFRPRPMDLRADEDRVQVTVWCGPADLLKGGAS